MTIYALDGHVPQIHPDAWVAPDANLIGRVVVEEGASVWFGTTIRADHEEIRIGEGSNVQENCVMHVDPGFPVVVGKGCTIGHKAILHGCTLADNVLVGIGAVVLNGARIGRNCLIGAGALVTEGKVIPDNALVMGMPGKVVREIDDANAARIARGAVHYREHARMFRDRLVEVE